MKTTLELVHDLQALLSGPEKWTKGSPVPGVGCKCLVAAITIACEYNMDAVDEIKDLARMARKDNGNLVAWNDAPERTFADIKALMAKMEELAKDQP